MYGVDLAAWWKARRWVALLELIDQLPTTSRLRAAMNDDDEYAELLLTEQDDTDEREPWSPPLTDWDLNAAIGAEQRDLLQQIVMVLAAIKGGIPVVQQERLRPPPKSKGKPFPRPETALDRARRRREVDAYLDGLAVFSPHALTDN